MLETIKHISSGKFVSRGEWIHPDRIIDSFELILVIEGDVYLNENGTEYSLHKNDVLLLDPHVRHFGYRSSVNTSFYWLHWNQCGLRPDIKQVAVKRPYNLSLLFNQLLHYSADRYDGEVLDCVTKLIIAELCRMDEKTEGNKLVNRVAEWIRVNIDLPIKVSDVSAQFGYHVDYLSRLFKHRYGQGLKEYIDNTKLQQIKGYLLNSNATLQEVAALCGFSEYKYFLKFFKYHEGMTPTEFCNVYSKTHINNQ